jgi:hypothetical protein
MDQPDNRQHQQQQQQQQLFNIKGCMLRFNHWPQRAVRACYAWHQLELHDPAMPGRQNPIIAAYNVQSYHK